MTYHIVCLTGSKDEYTPNLKKDDKVLVVPFNIPGHPDSFQTNIYDIFAQYGLSLSQIAHDLLNAVIAAYTADVRIAREDTFDGWTRSLILHLAVTEPDVWKQAIGDLEKALSFLTGDYWQVVIREIPLSYKPQQGREPKKVQSLNAQTVCLFSGGLDSFIGAVDQVEQENRIALVGHHSAGGGATSKSQGDTLKALHESYDKSLSPFLQVWLTPPKGESRASEISTRGRSMLFIGLGVVFASAMDADKLIIPENGLISLNVPLTNSRLGSFSTRTTHPYFISLIRNLISTIGMTIDIELPYRFYTKGEMIGKSFNREMIQKNVDATISCSHPGASRFTKNSPNMHCGYCYPCLIRRAAVYKTGVPDKTKYVYEDLGQPLSRKRRSDLRALKISLAKYEKRPAKIGDVLVSGPLPGKAQDLKEYLAVFNRGVDEVRSFLKQYE
jgi:7-cyano-7-deazaguanine synthase in queuosine biosynthesis